MPEDQYSRTLLTRRGVLVGGVVLGVGVAAGTALNLGAGLVGEVASSHENESTDPIERAYEALGGVETRNFRDVVNFAADLAETARDHQLSNDHEQFALSVFPLKKNIAGENMRYKYQKNRTSGASGELVLPAVIGRGGVLSSEPKSESIAEELTSNPARFVKACDIRAPNVSVHASLNYARKQAERGILLRDKQVIINHLLAGDNRAYSETFSTGSPEEEMERVAMTVRDNLRGGVFGIEFVWQLGTRRLSLYLNRDGEVVGGDGVNTEGEINEDIRLIFQEAAERFETASY